MAFTAEEHVPGAHAQFAHPFRASLVAIFVDRDGWCAFTEEGVQFAGDTLYMQLVWIAVQTGLCIGSNAPGLFSTTFCFL